MATDKREKWCLRCGITSLTSVYAICDPCRIVMNRITIQMAEAKHGD